MLAQQPILNLGTLGSVSSGKSTLILSLTGEKTQRFDSEKTRNITIKAGYANLKIVKNADGQLTSKSDKYKCSDDEDIVHRLSFVDCPGHQQLTQIMLGQVNLMAGAITVISMAEDIIGNSQLTEHLKAAKLAGISKIICCLNKCDLVSKETVKQKYQEVIKLFDIIGLPSPLCIIPTSFNRGLNVDYLIKAIMTFFNPVDYIHQNEEKPFFSVSRSFDINKPGANILSIKGGVLGGSLISGSLKVGDQVVIKPGNIINKNGRGVAQPIKTTVLSIMSEKSSLKQIQAGGLMAIQTDINPHFTKSDRMVGNVICFEDDDRFEIVDELSMKINFIDKKKSLNTREIVSIQIGPQNVKGTILSYKKKKYTIQLSRPCCIMKKTTLYLSSNSEKMTIIGSGIFF